METTCDFQFAFLYTSSLLKKGSTPKGKNLLPRGANSFPFRVDPFSEGRQNHFDRVSPLKVYSYPLTPYYTLTNPVPYTGINIQQHPDFVEAQVDLGFHSS